MRNALVLACSAVAIFLGGSTWFGFFPPVPADLGGAPNLDRQAERVRIPVEGGDALDGWYLAPKNGAVIVILHGFGRDHRRAWRYGGFLREAGYGLLAFDFRSSRPAGRLPTTLGHHEVADARAALRWLESRPELAGARIGMFGESLGGSVALIETAANPRIEALVVDCPFGNGVEALGDACERWAHLPRWPTVPVLRQLGRMATGHDPGGLNAVAAASGLRDRPVFFIYSRLDNRLGPKHVGALWQAAGSKDPLWMIDDAGHNEGWRRHRADYESRVRGFFDRSLLGQASGEMPAATAGTGGPVTLATP